MKRVAVYTAIFGGYDNLESPKVVDPNVDYICFTDSDLKSDVWNIKKVPAIYNDSTRCARKYKLLPHRYLSDYDISIWVDGNIVIHGNIDKFLSNIISGKIYSYSSLVLFSVKSSNALALRPRKRSSFS